MLSSAPDAGCSSGSSPDTSSLAVCSFDIAFAVSPFVGYSSDDSLSDISLSGVFLSMTSLSDLSSFDDSSTMVSL